MFQNSETSHTSPHNMAKVATLLPHVRAIQIFQLRHFTLNALSLRARGLASVPNKLKKLV